MHEPPHGATSWSHADRRHAPERTSAHSGEENGAEAQLEEVERVGQAPSGTPVWVASGVTADNIANVLGTAHGVIRTTSAKKDVDPANPVDGERAQQIAQAAGKARR